MGIRYSVLLLILLVILLLLPPLSATRLGSFLLALTFWGLLVAGALAAGRAGWARPAALALAGVALAVNIAAFLAPHLRYAVPGRLLEATFLFFVCGAILHHIVREERVTVDTILGGISVYLLIGIFFFQVYSALELYAPGSFLAGGQPIPAPGSAEFEGGYIVDFIYYSYVTLTTLGFGDIIPISPAARMAAALEAIIGQLYLTILIGVLVGVHIAQGSPGGPSAGATQEPPEAA
jgi:hypothetical protein